MTDWLERLRAGPALLLDGATGTELERRGAKSVLPLWSAHALLHDPALVGRIHADYVEAGAELLTANSFRTQRRTLERGGLGERAAALTAQAVALARTAAAGGARPVRVLGSAPPLEDCFRPDLVPHDDSLAREHAEHAANLAAAGVDAILVETMNTIREALAALRAARATKLPALVSFVCWDGPRLLSGEMLREAVEAVRAEQPAAVLANCLPPSNVPACLAVLAESGLPFGVYANLGAPLDEGGRARSEDCAPEPFGAHAASWLAAGATLVGGCCGTTPAHIRAVAQRMRSNPVAP
jgi:S-methylmethionine-dependent homocysteine/selenocysteine methylase